MGYDSLIFYWGVLTEIFEILQDSLGCYEILLDTSIFSGGSEILWDSLGFLEILGDSWTFSGILRDSWRFSTGFSGILGPS